MAVMPRDQMSHSSLYPPFRATAATSGAILGAETLREPGGHNGGGQKWEEWCGERDTKREKRMENKENRVQRESKTERKRNRLRETERER